MAEAEKPEAVKREEEIFAFWNERQIFEKSLDKAATKGDFVFYDGPPFATGLPHHGHILASTIKDAIPRYKTMRGYRVRRRWGWDCHGLPLENLIEKELGVKTKRDIEEMGVATFNEAARKAVLRYADEWKRIIPRVGRWVDMENDYKTMDTSYTESVWWAFGELHKKGLIEEGFKVMQLCPRCGTTLSNFEVSQGYKDIKDLTAIAKFELADESETYLLAWTTTPWTLPGNVALAVNSETLYAYVRSGEATYIVASVLVPTLFPEGTASVTREVKGSELVGRQYAPLFPGVIDALAGGREREKLDAAFHVYAADFVTTDEGTGIVHIAPAYGEEDLTLARKHSLPVVHHVGRDGRMSPAVPAVAGKLAKPKGNWKETDALIVEYLGSKLFLAEEKEHSYPHCWRCDTPLLNYASGSWFVTVPKLRDKLVAENAKIGWVPESVGKNRFDDWLKNARDWAISRSRYWGAPLPAWKNERTGALRVMGSIEELKRHARKSGNRYYAMRHGEAESNMRNIVSCDPDAPLHLTERGKEQVRATARNLLPVGVTRIYVSPYVRTRETAELVATTLGLPLEAIEVDTRLRELELGDFNGKPFDEFMAYREEHMREYDAPLPNGESYLDVKRRFGDFLYEKERTEKEETILIVTHGAGLETIAAAAAGANQEESVKHAFVPTKECAAVEKIDFVPLPHNEDYELDLHRPYIDEYPMIDEDGAELRRVPDVFDCWFESGSMSYAQDHYPFEKERFDPSAGLFKKGKGFPADFIAEGLDQTRGWFYTSLVLGVALFGRSPYKNAIATGLILAEDGRKMSKSLKNYPEPMDVVEAYGADALRLYLLSSPVIRAEDIRFSEKGVAEVANKVLGRLHNMLVFLETYAPSDVPERVDSDHVLDRWAMARLASVLKEATDGLENYEIDRATRPLGQLVDDLSTWYLRRSRERIKDSVEAASTLRAVLRHVAILFAPFTPFYAEHLYQRVKYADDAESVHLVDWPTGVSMRIGDADSLLKDMALARDIASMALKKRQEEGIKVRQPLAALTAPVLPKDAEIIELLKDEVNVKAVRSGGEEVELDTALTLELVKEGDERAFQRAVAEARKTEGLSPRDEVAVVKGEDGTYVAELSTGPVRFSLKRNAS
ncbi:MAG TPA: class I tRNA ligase family protein [Candidatus Paceibacterota bacterium]|nr:class I tRNA ligase family protein [Candidatus Paceibacterota bacterium]